MSIRFSLRHKLSAFAMLAAGLSVYSACNPLKPGERGSSPSRVSVAFDPTGLGDLAQVMKTLQFRVYGVTGEVRGTQEGPDVRMAIEAQKKSYTLGGVSLGWKEIEVSILDASNSALGTGSARVLVKPGLNKAGSLTIKIAAVSQPITTVNVELKLSSTNESDPSTVVKKATLKWQAQNAGASGEIELIKGGAVSPSYADVKAIFDGNCTDCHAEGSAQKKLELDKFPFKSGLIADSSALMAKIMSRVQDENKPMPTDGLLPAETIAKLKAWQDGGFLAEASSDAGLYRAQMKDLKVADKVTGTLTLFGVDGIELVKKDIEAYVVAENGVLKLVASLDLQSPQVEMEIIVERASP